MANFEDYADKNQNIRMARRSGILQIAVHTDGGSLWWNDTPHGEFVHAFADIGSDRGNKVVIMTGSGENFCAGWGGPRPVRRRPLDWDRLYWEGNRMITNLLDIEVPMISAVNGPALNHSEIPLLCDIVLAAEDAIFQDQPHFPGGLVPGDGVHVVYPLLLGLNRARYFLLTGQKLSAREAFGYGVVNDVLPRERLLPRAWE